VRHDSANDPMAEEYDALEHRNAAACCILDIFGYNGNNGSLLLAQVDRKSRVALEQQQPLTRPETIERAMALAGAVTHGQQFKVTGEHHLTSNDFMIAEALGSLEKEQRSLTTERKAQLAHLQQYESALPLLEKPEISLLAKDLDILLRFKLGALPGNLKTKADKLRRWQEVKDQPNIYWSLG